MKKLVTLLLIVSFVSGAALFAIAQDKGPEVIEFKVKKMGNSLITFPHADHQTRAECVTCHHQGLDDPTKMKCTSCHGVDKKIPSLKKAYHDKKKSPCMVCHKAEKSNPNAPQKCKDCHKKS